MKRISGQFLIVFTLLIAGFVPVLTIGDGEITVTPEVIELSGPKEVQTFKVTIHSKKNIKAVGFTFEIKDDLEDGDLAFFARNVKWKKEGNTYRYIDIYGRTAKLQVPKESLELEITVKANKEKTIQGFFKVYVKNKIAAQVPLLIKAPFNPGAALGDFFKKFKLYITVFVILSILIYIAYWYRKITKKRSKTFSTKASFSTLLKQNEGLVIHEFDNPFNCRLAGLNKKIKLSYRGSEINAWVGSSFHRFSDTEKIQLKINRFWELTIETQSFVTNRGNQNNLIIYLNPLS